MDVADINEANKTVNTNSRALVIYLSKCAPKLEKLASNFSLYTPRTKRAHLINIFVV